MMGAVDPNGYLLGVTSSGINILKGTTTSPTNGIALTVTNNNTLAIDGNEVATQTWVGNQGYLTSAALSTLTDVALSNPTQGQNLTYDATAGKWKNTSTTATVAWGGITGTLADQTDLKNALDGKLDAVNSKVSFINDGTEGDILYIDTTTGGSYGILVGDSTFGTAVTLGATVNNSGYSLQLKNTGLYLIEGTTSSASQYAVLTVSSSNELKVNGTSVALSTDLPSTMTGATSIAGGTSGLVPAPSSGDNDKILTGGATWSGLKTINNTSLLGSGNIGVLVNTATGTGSLTLLGTAASSNTAINIGYNSSVATGGNIAIGTLASTSGTGAVAIGTQAEASAINTIAIGDTAKATANNAIQIGYGTNNTANKFNVRSYELLDLSTGYIPNARINMDTLPGSGSGNAITSGAVYTALSGKQNSLSAGSNISISGDTISATDTTYSNFTGADSTTGGAAGLVPAPSAGDEGKYLKGDGTWGTVSTGGTVDQTYDGTSANAQSGVAIAGAGFLQNTATRSDSITLQGTTTNKSYAINIGYNGVVYDYCTLLGATASTGGNNSTAIGYYARCTGTNSTAVGYYSNANNQYATAVGSGATASNSYTLAVGTNATATYSRGTAIGMSTEATAVGTTALGSKAIASANSAMQLGYGTNSTANTLSIGFYNDANTHYNWQLLDGTTGLIPDARISSNIARTSAIPTVPTNISSFTNDSGYITGITSSDVTTALGYTPLRATNSNTEYTNTGTQTTMGYTDTNAGEMYGVLAGYTTYGTGVILGAQSTSGGYLASITTSGLSLTNGVTMKTAVLTVNNSNKLLSNGSEVALTSDLSTKQDTLVSGTNIKTINSTSLLSSGDLTLADTTLSNVSSISSSSAVYTALSGKADTTLSNVSSIDSNSAVKTALDTKVNTSDIWYDSTSKTLYIGVAQS